MRRLHDLDAKDRQILALLEADARRSNSDIARLTRLSAPTVAERIGRLRDIGVIRKFTVQLDEDRMGLPVAAIVEFEPHSNADGEGIAAVAGHPAVRSCYKVTGPAMLILVVRVASSGALNNLLLEFCQHGETRTFVILSSELEGLPVFVDGQNDPIPALLRRSQL